MELTLRLGAPIEEPKKTNTWRIHASLMHGDADHYTDATADFPFLEQAMWHFCLLLAFCAMSWNDACEADLVEEAVRKEAERQGMTSDRGYDWYEDFVEGDVTNCDALASPDKVWMTYFDGQGREFAVIAQVDGKDYESVDREALYKGDHDD